MSDNRDYYRERDRSWRQPAHGANINQAANKSIHDPGQEFGAPLPSEQLLGAELRGTQGTASENKAVKQPLPGLPEFYELVHLATELHAKKSHDYASKEDPVGNYRFSGEIAQYLFSHSALDAGFMSRWAEKIWRIKTLEESHLRPKNESVEDTEEDLVTITILWMASRRAERRRRGY